jgi:hypothetical protein
MLNMLATLAEYERQLIISGSTHALPPPRHNGTRFGRPI